MRRVLFPLVLLPMLSARSFAAQSFGSGSVIIPMDVGTPNVQNNTFHNQDSGMLQAYGLVYQLLLNGVPVNWCIRPTKTPYVYTDGTRPPPAPVAANADFVASAKRVVDGTTVTTNYGYRGGPFVIDSSLTAPGSTAMNVINRWIHACPAGQTTACGHTSVDVHQATASFTATVSRRLIHAPNIGVNADGNETIAFGYLNAAAIPDSKGQAWPGGPPYTNYPDVLTPAQVASGALFDNKGLPVFCQYMSMHWDIKERNDATMAQMSNFLNFPTHLFAECQAVNTIEDAATAHFLSTDNGDPEPGLVACPLPNQTVTTRPNNGFCKAPKQPQMPDLQFLNSGEPFTQLDGPFATVGGSELAYGTLPGPAGISGNMCNSASGCTTAPMTSFFDTGTILIQSTDPAAPGVLWMTGVKGGACVIDEGGGQQCAGFGKVSYLGGHKYDVNVPITSDGATQGTRLFLNSLFEAGCTTVSGGPNVTLGKNGPTDTSSAFVTYTIDWNNSGAGVALGATITDQLAAGMAFVSATSGGTCGGPCNGANPSPSPSRVTWSLGDLAPHSSGSVQLTVHLLGFGNYANTAAGRFKVGNSFDNVTSSELDTSYHAPPDMAVTLDLANDQCAGKPPCPSPAPANTCQFWYCDPSTGETCKLGTYGDGQPCFADDCTLNATCTAGACGGGIAVQCPDSGTPCFSNVCFPTGGGCKPVNHNGVSCSTSACLTGESCTGGACQGGSAITCPATTNPCQMGLCDSLAGCYFANINQSLECEDGDPCTSHSSCNDGVCGNPTTTVVCTTSLPCVVPVCAAGACASPSPVPAGTDPNGDCPSQGACSSTCDGAGACTVVCVGPGTSCSGDAQCSTGHCAAEHVCCDSVCDGPCRSCTLPGSVGICTFLGDGADPGGSCAAGQVCDGSGGCRPGPDMAVLADLSALADLSVDDGTGSTGGTSGSTTAGTTGSTTAGTTGSTTAGTTGSTTAGTTGSTTAGTTGSTGGTSGSTTAGTSGSTTAGTTGSTTGDTSGSSTEGGAGTGKGGCGCAVGAAENARDGLLFTLLALAMAMMLWRRRRG